ncbi:hypothetical protein NQ317_013012 [Molorchus minor]|uniref:CUB domain-containing protein n=1 Tax=Molorchus minor TaxID=1323400 RepID=A0ABQ9K3A6_9CUCU|nr:hypothetical protein NQ317_013012 [Molorchus minor]
MNMVAEGTKFFDCVWIIKPVENFLHRKTHLYVKVVEFYNFAGTTELVIRQGLTSTQPLADILRYPMTQFNNFKQTEHVASISKGFYIGLRGHFSPDSRLAIVFAAFNYKDCFGGSDYLCHNLRCIPVLLNCDGFDHCGDDSDELPSCSEGLIGIILSMALLLYRVNARNRHQRQIQDHMETIHAILEEGVSSIEEEVVVSDNPPDYEAPPDYEEIINLKYVKNVCTLKLNHKSLSKHIENSPKASTGELSDMNNCPPVASTSGICPIASDIIPDSPPPSYENIKKIGHEVIIPKNFYDCPSPGPSYLSFEFEHLEGGLGGAGEVQATNPEDVKITCRELIGHEREYFLNYRSTHLLGLARKMASFAKEKRARCVSESQLLSASVNRNSIGIKRSFSTDDQLIVK